MQSELELADPNVESGDSHDDLEDAHHAIDYVSGWIRAADTKAGLLSAAIALILTGTFGQDSPFTSDTQTGLESLTRLLIWVGLLLAVVSLAATITSRSRPGPASRFAFPTLADDTWNRPIVDRGQVAREAWAQAQALAAIARRKHLAVGVASWATFTSLFLLVCLLGFGR